MKSQSTTYENRKIPNENCSRMLYRWILVSAKMKSNFLLDQKETNFPNSKSTQNCEVASLYCPPTPNKISSQKIIVKYHQFNSSKVTQRLENCSKNQGVHKMLILRQF